MQPRTDDQATDNADAARDGAIARALLLRKPPVVEGLRRAGVGTGFFITRERVLTNFHVVDGCRALTVGNNREGAETLAKFVAGDPAGDLAVLATDAKSESSARFQSAISADAGEHLAIVGYPEHGLPVLEAELEQVLASPADFAADRGRYPFSGSVRRGNSGSPVLDERGAVIGVVTAKINTVAVYQLTGEVIDNIGVAITNRAVFDFLRANKIEFHVAMRGENLSPEQILREARGFVRQIGCWK